MANPSSAHDKSLNATARSPGKRSKTQIEFRLSKRRMMLFPRWTPIALGLFTVSCATGRLRPILSDFTPSGSERVRALDIYPGVTATLVAPAKLDLDKRVDLILYALPNGNSTAQTIGRKMAEGVDWHYDIQHIGAQTRALRAQGIPQAIVAYIEADNKSWRSEER